MDYHERIKEYYERRAAEYDDAYLGTGAYSGHERPGFEEELAEVTALIEGLPPARVLDIGCGTGAAFAATPTTPQIGHRPRAPEDSCRGVRRLRPAPLRYRGPDSPAAWPERSETEHRRLVERRAPIWRG
jgi:SAM-dependent methyltransferase